MREHRKATSGLSSTRLSTTSAVSRSLDRARELLRPDLDAQASPTCIVRSHSAPSYRRAHTVTAGGAYALLAPNVAGKDSTAAFFGAPLSSSSQAAELTHQQACIAPRCLKSTSV